MTEFGKQKMQLDVGRAKKTLESDAFSVYRYTIFKPPLSSL
jgi:hypothetical protein